MTSLFSFINGGKHYHIGVFTFLGKHPLDQLYYICSYFIVGPGYQTLKDPPLAGGKGGGVCSAATSQRMREKETERAGV